MTAKQIKYGDEARQLMVQGSGILTRAVKATLGPKGRNVILKKSFGSPAMTKDGCPWAGKSNCQTSSRIQGRIW